MNLHHLSELVITGSPHLEKSLQVKKTIIPMGGMFDTSVATIRDVEITYIYQDFKFPHCPVGFTGYNRSKVNWIWIGFIRHLLVDEMDSSCVYISSNFLRVTCASNFNF